jgi:hypothetical protein
LQTAISKNACLLNFTQCIVIKSFHFKSMHQAKSALPNEPKFTEGNKARACEAAGENTV